MALESEHSLPRRERLWIWEVYISVCMLIEHPIRSDLVAYGAITAEINCWIQSDLPIHSIDDLKLISSDGILQFHRFFHTRSQSFLSQHECMLSS